MRAVPSGSSGAGDGGGQEEGSELEMEGIWQLQAASNRSLAEQAVCNLRHRSLPFKHLLHVESSVAVAEPNHRSEYVVKSCFSSNHLRTPSQTLGEPKEQEIKIYQCHNVFFFF